MSQNSLARFQNAYRRWRYTSGHFGNSLESLSTHWPVVMRTVFLSYVTEMSFLRHVWVSREGRYLIGRQKLNLTRVISCLQKCCYTSCVSKIHIKGQFMCTQATPMPHFHGKYYRRNLCLSICHHVFLCHTLPICFVHRDCTFSVKARNQFLSVSVSHQGQV